MTPALITIYFIGIILIVLIFAAVHEFGDTYRFTDFLFVIFWPVVFVWIVGTLIVRALREIKWKRLIFEGKKL